MTDPHPVDGAALPVDDLIELLRIVTSSRTPSEIVALLGTSGAADESDSTGVEPTRFRSIRRIEIRPWTADEFGVAYVILADPGEWSLAAVGSAIGPLRPMPVLHRAAERLQGIWEDADAAGWAAVYLDLSGAPEDPATRIESMTIRMEPPRSDAEDARRI